MCYFFLLRWNHPPYSMCRLYRICVSFSSDVEVIDSTLFENSVSPASVGSFCTVSTSGRRAFCSRDFCITFAEQCVTLDFSILLRLSRTSSRSRVIFELDHQCAKNDEISGVFAPCSRRSLSLCVAEHPRTAFLPLSFDFPNSCSLEMVISSLSISVLRTLSSSASCSCLPSCRACSVLEAGQLIVNQHRSTIESLKVECSRLGCHVVEGELSSDELCPAVDDSERASVYVSSF